MTTIILDTETTDADPATCDYIEIGYLSIDEDITQRDLKVLNQFNKLYLPEKPISFGALATHHILPSSLKGADPSGSFSLKEDVTYIIGHNIDFDWKVIGAPDVRRICTLALARKHIPEIDSHTQSGLLYFIQGEEARETILKAHRAIQDCCICAEILTYLLNHHVNVSTIEELWEESEKARIPLLMPFGKHKGEKIDTIPIGYKSWLLGQPNVDPYLIRALTQ